LSSMDLSRAAGLMIYTMKNNAYSIVGETFLLSPLHIPTALPAIQ
jgi:hypothetical protein